MAITRQHTLIIAHQLHRSYSAPCFHVSGESGRNQKLNSHFQIGLQSGNCTRFQMESGQGITVYWEIFAVK